MSPKLDFSNPMSACILEAQSEHVLVGKVAAASSYVQSLEVYELLG